MTYRRIGAGVIAVVAGCSTAARDVARIPGEVEAVRCPDECTHSNGTGVYTEEGGDVGIGDSRLMITHFINHGGARVTFQARYRAGPDRWLLLEGNVARADHGGTSALVASVSESATMPTWTLVSQTATPATITVTDMDLRHLKLYLEFGIPPAGMQQVELQFEPLGPVVGSTIQRSRMVWRNAAAPAATPAPYCFDAAHAPDPVVFQQGIAVNPVTGAVTRSAATADFVTISCFLGAPATVHGWGYAYRSSPDLVDPFPARSMFYFDAGIQMKRASYCGDDKYYTRAGTQIHISDDRAVNVFASTQRCLQPCIEAFWTPMGASCVNLGNRRRPEMEFTGSCNNTPLPPCGLLPPVPIGPGGSPSGVSFEPYLADEPRRP